MQYEEFEKKLISKLLKNDKKCINIIEDNAKAVNNYLKNEEKPIHIKSLVSKLNDIIINELNKFKYIEKVLKHELFTEILKEFRESNILIRAIKNKKRDAVKWLMTMDINYFVQDENGVTALMEAAANSNYLFVVKEILEKNEEVVDITDNNDSNVLFYVTDEKIFSLLYNSKADFNHINKDSDTVLIKCCRRRFCPNFEKILNRTDNINHVNSRGKTAAMYLVENGRAEELKALCRLYPNLNYKNKDNKSALTILIDQFKDIYANDRFICMEDYVCTMIILMLNDCDFNAPIDKEGNTPIMFFIMAGDYFTSTLLLEKCKNLDLSIKNEHGISASYLLFWTDSNEKTFRQKILFHDTFDNDYIDNDNNNLIMHFLARGQINEEYTIALQKRKVKNHVNNKNENEIIIATKLGLLTDERLFDGNDVNQQDFNGNTALHYAIKLKDKYVINMLAYHKADPNIKNEQGLSAF
ncbi:ankyrin [Anaeromyces robustus]|uniref:Ankyrin n=1 Tax=Anaeromyces robustus TaxID=1754192 RepID=A0A1Y1X317_9FUNG|nr:ankyrin [Anaeromyces robustus]|eukprot:ORX80197.1 ankyrin [Anaeromyces robustus]